MYHIKMLLTFSLFVFTQVGYSQISIANIQKTESNSCEGSAVIVREDDSITELEVHYGSLTFMHEFESNTILLSDLCAGMYTVNYKDGDNCGYTLDFTIDNCNSIQISSTSTATCHDTPAVLSIDLPNDGNVYDAIWSNGQQGLTLTNVESGLYTVTVTDQNGCTSSKAIQHTDARLEINITDMVYPTLSNFFVGTVSVEASGGKAPYSWSWKIDNGTFESSTDEKTVSFSILNMRDIKLEVSVTDSDNCEFVKKVAVTSACIPNGFPLKLSYYPFSINDLKEQKNIRFKIKNRYNELEYEIFRREPSSDPSIVNIYELIESGWKDIEVEGNSRFIELAYTEPGEYRFVFKSPCDALQTNTVMIDKIINCEFTQDDLPALNDLLTGYNAFCANFGVVANHLPFWEDHPDVPYEEIHCIDFPESPICDLPSFAYYRFDGLGVGRCDYSIGCFSCEILNEDPNLELEEDTALFGLVNYNEESLIYKMYENKDYTFEIELENGCVHTIINNNKTFTNSADFIQGGTIEPIAGIDCLASNFTCLTCHDIGSRFPEEYYKDFLYNPDYCRTSIQAPVKTSYFAYRANDDIDPFGLGGKFQMTVYPGPNFETVEIPAGTPYISISSEDGPQEHSNSLGRAIFAAGYASSPAYQEYPIYVHHVEDPFADNLSITINPPDILDPECENELIQLSFIPCTKEVYCYDDFPPELIGTLPDLESLTPCMASAPTGCIVLAYCSDTGDYYYQENGELFIYDELDCDDPDIIYCSDLGLAPLDEDDNSVCDPACGDDYVCNDGDCIYIGNTAPDCSSSNPCPTGQYCDEGTCSVCPTVDISFQYGNNGDCNFEVSFSTTETFLAEIDAYEDGAMINGWPKTLSISSFFGPLVLGLPVTQDCEEHDYKFHVHFNTCPVATGVTTGLKCLTGCLVGGNGGGSSSIVQSNNDDKSNSHELLKMEVVTIGANNLFIYPNPSDESVNLYLTKDHLINNVRILDTTGKLIKESNSINANSKTLNLTNIQTGLYIIMVTDTSGKTMIDKLVKR